MRLYHGTPSSRGEKIIEDKVILHNVKRLYNDHFSLKNISCNISYNNVNIPSTLETTDGYVYLTDSLFYAIYYGNKNSISLTHDDFFYVFQVDVDLSELEPDTDEIMMTTSTPVDTIQHANDSLACCRSARLAKSISSTDYLIKYIKLPTTSNFDDKNSHLIQKIVKEFSREFDASNEHIINYVRQLKNDLFSTYPYWEEL